MVPQKQKFHYYLDMMKFHLKIGSDGNEFIVFSEGLRGGKDYESDTYRVSNIIENEF